MFGDNQKNTGLRSRHATCVAAGTEVIGEINFSGTIDIQGVVRGNVVASAMENNVANERAAAKANAAQVRVLPGGEVLGDIAAPVVVINGKVEGNIYSSQRVELAAGAEVYGDVHYCIIEMVQGAQVNGSLLYTPQEPHDGEPVRPANAQLGELEAGTAKQDPAARQDAKLLADEAAD